MTHRTVKLGLLLLPALAAGCTTMGTGFGAGMIEGGVELCAVAEPAGVANGVPLDLGVGF